MRLGKLAACGGVAGPVLFTVAWVVSSLRQAGHPAAGVQLSGLAAEDARDPQLMMAAFAVLGACSIGFGAALREVAGYRRAGPWLVMVAGAAAMAVFASRAAEPWNGTVQRAAVTLALAAEVLAAARMLTLPDARTRHPGATVA